MIIHSVMPNAFLMPEAPEDKTAYKIVGQCRIAGQYVDGAFKISQVISTNPADYLNASYTPGKTIN